MARTPQDRMDEHIAAMRASHLGRQTDHVITLAGQVNYYEELVPTLEQRIRELEAQVRGLEAQVARPTAPRRPRRVFTGVTNHDLTEAGHGG